MRVLAARLVGRRGQRAEVARRALACVETWVDMRAGWPMAQDIYCSQQRTRRDMAILLLIDVSGSTDGWISSNRRVVDVER